MKKVLVVIPMTEEEKQQLSGILPDGVITYSKSKEVTIEEVQESEIILGNVSLKKIQGSKKLKWLQLNSAGTDGYCVDGVLPEGTILTNASGAYGVAISEHMLGMILALQKNYILIMKIKKSIGGRMRGMLPESMELLRLS